MTQRSSNSAQSLLLGDESWFAKKGLNDYGYVPGVSGSFPNVLPKNICGEEDCVARWGQKSSGCFWYARAAKAESPRQMYRIERLYQLTHQRPVGVSRCIGMAFARGLLAEKKGYAINWAAFAVKQCTRGCRRFQTFEEYKNKCERGLGVWPPNEVSELEESTLEGAPDDWIVNRKVRELDMELLSGFDFSKAVHPKPSIVISSPLYGSVDNLGRDILQSCGPMRFLLGDHADSNSDGEGGRRVVQHVVGNLESGLRNSEGSSVVLRKRGFVEPSKSNRLPLDTEVGALARIDHGKGLAKLEFSRRGHATEGNEGAAMMDRAELKQEMIQALDMKAAYEGFHQKTYEEQKDYLLDLEEEFLKERKRRRLLESAREEWLRSHLREAYMVLIDNSDTSEGVAVRISAFSQHGNTFVGEGSTSRLELPTTAPERSTTGTDDGHQTAALEGQERNAGPGGGGISAPHLEDLFSDCDPEYENPRVNEVPVSTVNPCVH